jgi:DNA polymerase-3 subunit gamma/tau
MEENKEFIVSARKYRPQTFDDVVGQMHITNTLRNAIKTNKIAHAFLFCGPRGVGKTTCARIVAKTLNCLQLSSSIDPCNQCESCKGFNSSHSFNIFELDAASNNSVDDIRSLIDQVRILPQIGKYSVFIIDEVHMLSANAFNAFLKTLEEPPSHAIFILATTEKHKILPTILSRCQVFDFHRITIDDMANHLARISVKEGVDAEPDALHVIAQKADGALRDALSIFDRIVTFSGNKMTYRDVIDNLNILDYDYYFKVTELAYQGNFKELLLLFNDVLNNGFDGQQFIGGLGDHLRNLLVGQDEITIKLLEVGEQIKERYYQQAKLTDVDFLMQALEIINQTDVTYRTSNNKRLLVEICLMQLAGLKKKALK